MIPLAKRKIALVGGAGFIGHNLALALHKQGAYVEIIDSLHVNNLLSFASGAYGDLHNRDLYLRIINQRLDLLREAGILVYVQDARDYNAMTRLLAKMKPDAVIHLAAVAHANRSNKDPYSTFDHSLRTLENVLDYSRGNVEHFIYFSSSMVYGNFKTESVNEETICDPIGIYGALKFAGEKMVIAYNQVFDLPFTIIRPSALYGERCVSRRVGQVFIESAMEGADVTINGDGSDALDFTYIGDLVNGISNVLQREEAKNQLFNLTYGKARSMTEMANILKTHFPSIKINYVPKDKLMPDRGTLSIEKAKNLIGYQPQFPLEKGFEQYVSWYKTMIA
jgi:nucleoside-diphosphate-sugar epimerase